MAKKTIIDEIANANGKYDFPEDFADGLLSRQRSMERRLTNVLNYGHESGFPAIKRQGNSTQIELASLQKKTDEARLLYACYIATEPAPAHLRTFLFENLKIWLNEHGRHITAKCSRWTASVLPPAWTHGWEKEDLCGWLIEYQIEDLMPAAGMEIGRNVLAPAYDDELVEGTIIGYTYLQEKLRPLSYSYGGYERCGRYVIQYDVKYGPESYKHSLFPMKAIKFPSAVAV